MEYHKVVICIGKRSDKSAIDRFAEVLPPSITVAEIDELKMRFEEMLLDYYGLYATPAPVVDDDDY